MDKKINLFLEKLKGMPDFDKVRFVILFGSQINGTSNKMSDHDFAVYFDGDRDERFKFRMGLLGRLPDEFDVQIFQDLPLFVRKSVFKGKVIYAENLDFVYDVAYETIKSYGYFRKYYEDYIKNRPSAR